MSIALTAPTINPALDTSLHIKSILVPTDFSSGAVKALHYAVHLAHQFGAKVTVVHVFPEQDFSYEEAGLDSMNAAYRAAAEEHRARLESTRKGLEHWYPVHAEAVFCEGNAHEQIASTARSIRADLIVIATHGYTGLEHLIHLGSTAERVVRSAPCPVLVVREHEQDFVH